MRQRYALWTSTSAGGGISSFVVTMQDTELWRDWSVRHIATHNNGTAMKRVIIFAASLLTFLSQLVFHRPSVVHLHSAAWGSFVRKSILAWLSAMFRVPVVLHMHGADFHIFFGESARPVQYYIRATLQHADVLVALGDAWAETLRVIAPRARIVVVPNAIKPSSAVSQHIEGPVNVVFLGEIGDRKGTFTLLKAWSKMLNDISNMPKAVLTIAGDGDVDRARTQVAELDIATTVTIRDWMTRSEVAEFLSQAHILVLPSQDEGQPMAILEAMARGLCVVSTNVGGIPELLGDDCGVVIRPDRIDDLAQAMADVIVDQDKRAYLGRRAHRKVSDRFDVDVVSRRFDEIYVELTK